MTDKIEIMDATAGEHIAELLNRGFMRAVATNKTVLVRHNDRIISIGVVSS